MSTPQPEEIPTPRTDAAETHPYSLWHVTIEFARTELEKNSAHF